MTKHFVAILFAAALCTLMGGCGAAEAEAGRTPARSVPEGLSEAQLTAPSEGALVAVIATSRGEISLVLFPEQAPMAVENFVGLAQQGYYNGLPFHRVIEGFLIQTGDAEGTGSGGDTIWSGNAYPNEISDALHHYAGAVGMAHAEGDAVGNRSQFYIVQSAPDSVDDALAKKLEEAGVREPVVAAYRAVGGAPYLDNLNTVFGQVYAGMDVVDAIAAVECGENDRPLEDVLVESVTIGNYSAAAPAA